MTLAEIAACGTPAILIPYPHAAHNHQEVNARNLVERGAAGLILDRELTGERLAREIAHLLADRQALRRMSAHARTFARPDAAERLARSLERLATPTREETSASVEIEPECTGARTASTSLASAEPECPGSPKSCSPWATRCRAATCASAR